MAQIGKLTQFQKGQAPQASLLNTNFETLRLANNDIVNRLLALVDNPDFILPEKYDVIISEIAEIASLNLFGTVDEVTYDNNKLSATRYNENLEAFRAAILLRGLNVKNHEVSTLGYDDSILLGTETAQGSLPIAPSNLEITGVLIDGGTYGVSGDRIIGLEWTDNSDNETGFEIYQSTVDMNDVDDFTMKFSPDDGAILMSTLELDITSALINAGQDFLYPLPEDMVVPDPETPPASLTIFNKLPLDNNELRGHNINYWMRASSLAGYSEWSNKVYTGKWLENPTPFEPRPSINSIEYSGGNLVIDFDIETSNLINPRLGFEVYISYAESDLSGFEDFSTFPWKLVYKDTTPQSGSHCEILFDYTPPIVTDTNKYLLVKVVSFNALQRSVVSINDREDVITMETPIINDKYLFTGNASTLSKKDLTNYSVINTSDLGNTNNISDMCSDGTYVYVCKQIDLHNYTLYKVDKNLNVITSLATGNDFSSGLSTDGTYLYGVSSGASPHLQKRLCSDLSLVSEVIGRIGLYPIMGMVVDGNYLLVSTSSRYIYQLNTSDLSQTGLSSSKTSNITPCLTIIEDTLFCGGTEGYRIFKFNKNTLTPSGSNSAAEAVGLCTDGTYLYSRHRSTTTLIYKYNTALASQGSISTTALTKLCIG